jgi:hypothetical protein
VKDVTLLLNTYRECARGVWNNFLRADADSDGVADADFDRVDAFSALCEVLLAELVPIMINRPSQDGNKYWDDPVGQIGQEGVKLLLIDYFDWDQMGFIDFQYYRVKVIGFEQHPHLVGREALLDVHHGNVVFEL